MVQLTFAPSWLAQLQLSIQVVQPVHVVAVLHAAGYPWGADRPVPAPPLMARAAGLPEPPCELEPPAPVTPGPTAITSPPPLAGAAVAIRRGACVCWRSLGTTWHGRIDVGNWVLASRSGRVLGSASTARDEQTKTKRKREPAL